MKTINISFRRNTHTTNGFTLIELLVVLAIISIIASSAIPAYSSYTINSRKTFAMMTITEISLALERYYSDLLSYQVDLETLKIPDNDRWFEYSITNADKYSYQIEATPKPDSKVSIVFRIDHLGRQFYREVSGNQWIRGWP